MSLQLIGTNQTNSTLLAYDGSTKQINLFSAFGAANNSQNGQLPGFNGERPDPFTGVTHLGNGYRAYNPILMRFTCPDNESPFGVGGINPYAYCENDPLNFTDPSGHGIFKFVVMGLTSLFKHLFEEETAKAIAKSVAKVTKYTLTYGTQLASSMTNAASYMLEKDNPQVAAKFAKASFALGLINTASSLYSSYHGIYKNIKSLLTREGAQEVEQVIAKSITELDELGNHKDAYRLSGVTLDQSSTDAEDFLGKFVETALDMDKPLHKKELPFYHQPHTIKAIYQIISTTASLTSSALNIASHVMEETDPKKAAKLSLASSAFGLTNIVMDFASTVHSVKDKAKRFQYYWSALSSRLELQISPMSYPAAILPPNFMQSK